MLLSLWRVDQGWCGLRAPGLSVLLGCHGGSEQGKSWKAGRERDWSSVGVPHQREGESQKDGGPERGGSQDRRGTAGRQQQPGVQGRMATGVQGPKPGAAAAVVPSTMSPTSPTSLSSPGPDHGRYLGKSNKPKLLGQERVVGEADLCPDGLVDGAVPKVHLCGEDFQVRGSDNGLDSELHWFDLRCEGPSTLSDTGSVYTMTPRTTNAPAFCCLWPTAHRFYSESLTSALPCGREHLGQGVGWRREVQAAAEGPSGCDGVSARGCVSGTLHVCMCVHMHPRHGEHTVCTYDRSSSECVGTLPVCVCR